MITFVEPGHIKTVLLPTPTMSSLHQEATLLEFNFYRRAPGLPLAPYPVSLLHDARLSPDFSSLLFNIVIVIFSLAVNNNRPRFPNGGRGVIFRNEGGRGRGNYGGNRGYNRGDFNGRNEFGNRGNRGGFVNRGGDGYQRTDHVATNGGRVNRANGLTVNAAAKTTAPRVPAPA